jgi:hypothetical protein
LSPGLFQIQGDFHPAVPADLGPETPFYVALFNKPDLVFSGLQGLQAKGSGPPLYAVDEHPGAPGIAVDKKSGSFGFIVVIGKTGWNGKQGQAEEAKRKTDSSADGRHFLSIEYFTKK